MLKTPEHVAVCRVEHVQTGEGPYREEFYNRLKDMHEEHSGNDDHPTPSKDDMGYYGYHHMLFGFKSMEQLDAWFEPKFKQLMHELGFIIREYTVPIDFVIFGGHQVAFDQDESTMCGEKKLWEPLAVTV